MNGRIEVTHNLSLDPTQVIAVQHTVAEQPSIILYTAHWMFAVQLKDLTAGAWAQFLSEEGVPR